MSQTGCERFVPFTHDLSVCDTCGYLADNHNPAAMVTPERTKSLWRTLLRLGGVWSYYGSCVDRVNSGPYGRHGYPEIREHMAHCSPRWEVMSEPMIDGLSYFAGTFTDGDYRTEVLAGRLTCECGTLVQVVIAFEGTLGQLIWHAVHEGDYPEDAR